MWKSILGRSERAAQSSSDLQESASAKQPGSPSRQPDSRRSSRSGPQKPRTSDRGIEPTSSTYTSTNRSADPGTTSASVASSYATANTRNQRAGSLEAEQLKGYNPMEEDRRQAKNKASERGLERGQDSDQSSSGERRRRKKKKKDRNRADSGEGSGKRRDSGRTRSEGGDRGGAPANSRPDSHIQSQFPGEFPSTFAEPYRPPGEAAEYYGDHGESVASQPGVRPNAPSIIVGAEPHLQEPSVEANPPVEPSAIGQVGAAASFYSAANEGGTAQATQASKPPRPGKNNRPSNSSKPSKPSKADRPSLRESPSLPPISIAGAAGTGLASDYYHFQQSASTNQQDSIYQTAPASFVTGDANTSRPNGQYQSSHAPTTSSVPLYGTAAAAGIAAGTYYAAHHDTHDTSYRPSATSVGGQYMPTTPLKHRHRHSGPFHQLVDFIRDPDGVAEYEAYTEYIGVCRYCFEPGSSPRDAPRRHNYRGRFSGGRSGGTDRIDKSNRYPSSDEERRRKSGKGRSWVAVGATGYGLAKVGQALLNNKDDFDDTYSVKSGRPLRPGDDGYSYDRTSRVEARDGTDSKRTRRLYERDGRVRLQSNEDYSTAETAWAGSQQSKQKGRPPHDQALGSYVDLTHTTATKDKNAFETFFTSPTANRTKSGKRKNKGLFTFNNASSSSSDADLAFGSGFVKRKSSKRKKSPRRKQDVDAAILELGTTVVALTASGSMDRRKGKSHAELYAAKESRDKEKRNHHRDSKRHGDDVASDDEWEDAPDDDASSLDSGLAYGVTRRSSRESLSPVDAGTDKWGWRGERQRKDKTQSQGPAPESAAMAGDAMAPGSVFGQNCPSNSVTSSQPLKYVMPMSTSDPNDFDTITYSSRDSPVVSRSGSIPLQQPQPIVPVGKGIYTEPPASSYPSQTPLLDHILSYGSFTESPTQINARPSMGTGDNDYRPSRSRTDKQERRRRNTSPAAVPSGLAGSTSFQNASPSVTFDIPTESRRRDREDDRKERRSKDERRERRSKRKSDPKYEPSEAETRSRRETDETWAQEADLDRELKRLEREHAEAEESRKSGSSWVGPAAAGAATAALITEAMVRKSEEHEESPIGERKKDRKSRRSREEEVRSEVAEERKPERSESLQRRLAKMAAERIKTTPSPSHEDYATYFVPVELRERVKDGQNGAVSVVEAVPHFVNVTPAPMKFAFPEELYRPFGLEPDDDPTKFPWVIPLLRLQDPTPVPSAAGSVRGDASPVIQPRGQEADETNDNESSKDPRTSWGENKSHEHDVSTPEEERQKFVDAPDERTYDSPPSDTSETTRERRRQRKKRDQEAEADVDPTTTNETKPTDVQGNFGSDLEFAAALAAGAASAGFDPNIVIDDPAYHRRESPPGSENDNLPRAPLAETVLDPGSVAPASSSQPRQGFVEGELPDTPKEERKQLSDSPKEENSVGPSVPGSIHVFDYYEGPSPVLGGGAVSQTTPVQTNAPLSSEDRDIDHPRDKYVSDGITDTKIEGSGQKSIQVDPSDFVGSTHVTGHERIPGRGFDNFYDVVQEAASRPSALEEGMPPTQQATQKSKRSKDYFDDVDQPSEQGGVDVPMSSKKKSKREPKRYSVIFDDDDVLTTVSAPGDDGLQNGKKPRRKSKREGEELDDNSSAVSTPVTRKENEVESKRRSKDKKSGGLFGGFFETVKAAQEAAADDKAQDRDETFEASESHNDHDDRLSERRMKRDKDRHRIDEPTEDDPSRSLEEEMTADGVDSNGEPLKAERPEMPASTEGVSGLETPLSPSLPPHQPPPTSVDPRRSLRSRSVSPQSNTHPQGLAQPASVSRNAQMRQRRLSEIRTGDFEGSLVTAISPTAVPLHFRRPPPSPSHSRSDSVNDFGSTSLLPVSPLRVPRTRKERPRSTEFKSSKEFRPLWLLERHASGKAEPETEGTYPALPSSRESSANPSLEDLTAIPQERASVGASPPHNELAAVGEGQDYWASNRARSPDYLDSRQATPTTAHFPFSAKKEKPKYEFHSPSELLGDLKREHESASDPMSPMQLPQSVDTDAVEPFDESGALAQETLADSVVSPSAVYETEHLPPTPIVDNAIVGLATDPSSEQSHRKADHEDLTSLSENQAVTAAMEESKPADDAVPPRTSSKKSKKDKKKKKCQSVTFEDEVVRGEQPLYAETEIGDLPEGIAAGEVAKEISQVIESLSDQPPDNKDIASTSFEDSTSVPTADTPDVLDSVSDVRTAAPKEALFNDSAEQNHARAEDKEPFAQIPSHDRIQESAQVLSEAQAADEDESVTPVEKSKKEKRKKSETKVASVAVDNEALSQEIRAKQDPISEAPAQPTGDTGEPCLVSTAERATGPVTADVSHVADAPKGADELIEDRTSILEEAFERAKDARGVSSATADASDFMFALSSRQQQTEPDSVILQHSGAGPGGVTVSIEQILQHEEASHGLAVSEMAAPEAAAAIGVTVPPEPISQHEEAIPEAVAFGASESMSQHEEAASKEASSLGAAGSEVAAPEVAVPADVAHSPDPILQHEEAAPEDIWEVPSKSKSKKEKKAKKVKKNKLTLENLEGPPTDVTNKPRGEPSGQPGANEEPLTSSDSQMASRESSKIHQEQSGVGSQRLVAEPEQLISKPEVAAPEPITTSQAAAVVDLPDERIADLGPIERTQTLQGLEDQAPQIGEPFSIDESEQGAGSDAQIPQAPVEEQEEFSWTPQRKKSKKDKKKGKAQNRVGDVESSAEILVPTGGSEKGYAPGQEIVAVDSTTTSKKGNKGKKAKREATAFVLDEADQPTSSTASIEPAPGDQSVVELMEAEPSTSDVNLPPESTEQHGEQLGLETTEMDEATIKPEGQTSPASPGHRTEEIPGLDHVDFQVLQSESGLENVQPTSHDEPRITDGSYSRPSPEEPETYIKNQEDSLHEANVGHVRPEGNLETESGSQDTVVEEVPQHILQTERQAEQNSGGLDTSVVSASSEIIIEPEVAISGAFETSLEPQEAIVPAKSTEELSAESHAVVKEDPKDVRLELPIKTPQETSESFDQAASTLAEQPEEFSWSTPLKKSKRDKKKKKAKPALGDGEDDTQQATPLEDQGVSPLEDTQTQPGTGHDVKNPADQPLEVQPAVEKASPVSEPAMAGGAASTSDPQIVQEDEWAIPSRSKSKKDKKKKKRSAFDFPGEPSVSASDSMEPESRIDTTVNEAPKIEDMQVEHQKNESLDVTSAPTEQPVTSESGIETVKEPEAPNVDDEWAIPGKSKAKKKDKKKKRQSLFDELDNVDVTTTDQPAKPVETIQDDPHREAHEQDLPTAQSLSAGLHESAAPVSSNDGAFESPQNVADEARSTEAGPELGSQSVDDEWAMPMNSKSKKDKKKKRQPTTSDWVEDSNATNHEPQTIHELGIGQGIEISGPRNVGAEKAFVKDDTILEDDIVEPSQTEVQEPKRSDPVSEVASENVEDEWAIPARSKSKKDKKKKKKPTLSDFVANDAPTHTTTEDPQSVAPEPESTSVRENPLTLDEGVVSEEQPSQIDHRRQGGILPAALTKDHEKLQEAEDFRGVDITPTKDSEPTSDNAEQADADRKLKDSFTTTQFDERREMQPEVFEPVKEMDHQNDILDTVSDANRNASAIPGSWSFDSIQDAGGSEAKQPEAGEVSQDPQHLVQTVDAPLDEEPPVAVSRKESKSKKKPKKRRQTLAAWDDESSPASSERMKDVEEPFVKGDLEAAAAAAAAAVGISNIHAEEDATQTASTHDPVREVQAAPKEENLTHEDSYAGPHISIFGPFDDKQDDTTKKSDYKDHRGYEIYERSGSPPTFLTDREIADDAPEDGEQIRDVGELHEETQPNRDSAVHLNDSPLIGHEHFHDNPRDSGYVPSPTMAAANPIEGPREKFLTAQRPPRPLSPTSSAEDVRITSQPDEERSGHITSHPEAVQGTTTDSNEDIETSSDQPGLPYARTERKSSTTFDDYEEEHIRTFTPERINRQPSPVDSTSKDRSSNLLFGSSPSNRAGALGAPEHESQTLHRTSSGLHRTVSIHGHRGSHEGSLHRAYREHSPSRSIPSPIHAQHPYQGGRVRESHDLSISPPKTPLGTINESEHKSNGSLSRDENAKSPNKSQPPSTTARSRRNRPEPIEASSSTHDPVLDKGKGRARDMAGVYDGWGEAPGSPLSPTRPPSVRHRRSIQHIQDLEQRLDQLASENRLLASAKITAEKHLEDLHFEQSKNENASQEAIQTREVQLREKDADIERLKETLEHLQNEVVRLTQVNEGLTSANFTLARQHEDRVNELESERGNTREQWEESTRELESLREQHNQLSSGMEEIVRHEIDTALADKNLQIERLQSGLESAKDKIRELQQQLLDSQSQGLTGDDDIIPYKDEDYFETACQNLCQHVKQWVLRFSKFSDTRVCRLISEIRDEKIVDRFDNAILDGSEVDTYLSNRTQRRDVFMSVVMTMIFEYIFSRYLFGMDREQRQKLKQLEKSLSEIGPPSAVNRWRALTLTILSKRPQFQTQKASDTEAVAHEIFATLSKFLPPPQHLEHQILASLISVLRLAVDLSIEMRTQRAEYIMLPPLQPEYDVNGDLARKVYFTAGLMNERSGDFASNEELEDDAAVVRMVLFPLVVKKDHVRNNTQNNDDAAEGGEEDARAPEREDEVIVCPAQVLVARPPKTGGETRSFSASAARSDGGASSVTMMPPPGGDMENMI